jgi:predicted short-subunit dehydrogenase-like oxidoreductase (DUF2520 family)
MTEISTINIIGAGRVGRALGRLFASQSNLRIQQVFNRTQESNELAIKFIGDGIGITQLKQLAPADIIMLSVADDQLSALCQQLVAQNLLRPGSVLFHCSGSKSSELLQAAKQFGIAVASVHPVRSFANPDLVARNFKGTFCSVEGDLPAIKILINIFEAIGAQMIQIDAAHKSLYHAASVFGSNYLVTLMNVALEAYQAAGIAPQIARQLLQPLATQTLDNVFQMGVADALTGPIARGDMDTVMAQEQIVRTWNAPSGQLYHDFIAPTLHIAQQKKSIGTTE